ncbi:MAG TPA: hypothetical protein ENN17_12230 [bacterium]|nr:hypothetical protein [bacterium]
MHSESAQLSFFSTADEVIEKTVSAIRELDFDRARRELETAARIDPCLAHIETWRKIVTLFYAGFSGGQPGDALAALWHTVAENVENGHWLPSEAQFADREIAEIAFRHLGNVKGFLDSDQTLHAGSLLAARGLYQEAGKALIDTLTGGHADRADLWSVYAETLRVLGRPVESRNALLRALVLDPFHIDLFRLRLPELQSLYVRVRMQYTPAESRALLFFYGWLDGLWPISLLGRPGGIRTEDIQKRLEQASGEEHTDRFRRFGLYCYRDQMLDSGRIDIEARQQMMDSAPDLFRLYLKKVDEKQSELFTASRREPRNDSTVP